MILAWYTQGLTGMPERTAEELSVCSREETSTVPHLLHSSVLSSSLTEVMVGMSVSQVFLIGASHLMLS